MDIVQGPLAVVGPARDFSAVYVCMYVVCQPQFEHGWLFDLLALHRLLHFSNLQNLTHSSSMRLVWQLIAGLVLLGVAQVCADSRHDNLDATKHPPEHFYVNGNR